MPEPGLWNYPTLGNANLTTEAPRWVPLPQFRPPEDCAEKISDFPHNPRHDFQGRID